MKGVMGWLIGYTDRGRRRETLKLKFEKGQRVEMEARY